MRPRVNKRRKLIDKILGRRTGSPSRDNRKSIGAAVQIRARHDVGEVHQTTAVDSRVQKAEQTLAFRDQIVIQQRVDGCHDLYIGGQLGDKREKRGRKEETHGRRAAFTAQVILVTVEKTRDFDHSGNIWDAATPRAA